MERLKLVGIMILHIMSTSSARARASVPSSRAVPRLAQHAGAHDAFTQNAGYCADCHPCSLRSRAPPASAGLGLRLRGGASVACEEGGGMGRSFGGDTRGQHSKASNADSASCGKGKAIEVELMLLAHMFANKKTCLVRCDTCVTFSCLKPLHRPQCFEPLNSP